MGTIRIMIKAISMQMHKIVLRELLWRLSRYSKLSVLKKINNKTFNRVIMRFIRLQLLPTRKYENLQTSQKKVGNLI